MDIHEIYDRLYQCADDISHGRAITLDGQIRAYDLLDALSDSDIDRDLMKAEEAQKAAEAFMKAYAAAGVIEYDEVSLKNEMNKRLEPLDKALTEARFEAAGAASLHEFAKQTFEIWSNSGIFARRRALKELRERAGFRLEAHRIGNYVAKTFDLMNAADSRFAKAQQNRFAADVSYKIKAGTYENLARIIDLSLK